MKQSDLGLIFFVVAGFEVRLEKITGMARQSKIIEIFGAAARLRMDVLYLEGKIEDTFWCVTILAPIRRAFSNSRVSRIHGCWVGT